MLAVHDYIAYFYDNIGSETTNSIRFIKEIVEYRRVHLTRLDLFLLLQYALSLEASNPRDKTYALLALAAENERDGLDPDYSLSLAEVYTFTAAFLLEDSRDAVAFTGMDRKINVPSWVPDWTATTVP